MSLDEDTLREYFNNVDNKNSPSVDELTPGTVTRTFYGRMPARDTLGVELYPPSAVVSISTYISGKDHHRLYLCGSTMLVESADKVTENFTGKEKDDETELNYFGARYLDPMLGMWISVDPARQFANPYTYGGDPINYIDPTGMFALGSGVIISWDQQHGWGFGLGVADDFSFGEKLNFGGSLNLSYIWHEDGSDSFNAGVGGCYQYWIFNFYVGLGYSYNSVSGQSLTTRGGACVGNPNVACAGVEVGGGAYWDGDGEFMGTTAYAEAYGELFGGAVRESHGYEQGFLGMEGRGLYAGLSVAGLHAEWSQNGKYSFGLRENINVVTYQNKQHSSGFDKKTLKEAYEMQLACGENCEVLFTKDGRTKVVNRSNDEEHHFNTDDFLVRMMTLLILMHGPLKTVRLIEMALKQVKIC